jgi:putative membrane protein
MVRSVLGIVLRFAGSAAAVWVAALVFDRDLFDHALALKTGSTTETATTLAIVVVIFGLVNLLVKPIVRFVTFPIRILTFGLFSLVINGAMLLLTGFICAYFKLAFHVAATWWVIVAALFIGIASGVFSWIADKITAKSEPKRVTAPPPLPQPRYPQPGQQQAWDQQRPYGR